MVGNTTPTNADSRRPNAGIATKKGHIAAACRQKLKSAKPRQIHATSDGLEEQPSEFDLPVDCLKNALSEPMTVVVNINETPVKMEVDTGYAFNHELLNTSLNLA